MDRGNGYVAEVLSASMMRAWRLLRRAPLSSSISKAWRLLTKTDKPLYFCCLIITKLLRSATTTSTHSKITEQNDIGLQIVPKTICRLKIRFNSVRREFPNYYISTAIVLLSATDHDCRNPCDVGVSTAQGVEAFTRR